MKIAELFRQKPIDNLAPEEENHGLGLHKTLGVKDLTFLGIAAVIGAGIFSTIGSAAYQGGPGVSILFIITAITCGFTALCYAEFASRVPVSGSAYTYSYVTFGEVVAWIIGWALILEYAIGNIVVAISWSAYFNNILQAVHIHLPEWLTIGYQPAKIAYETALADGKDIQNMAYYQAPGFMGLKLIINLPALIVVIFVTWLAYIGIKESKNSANAMVWLKIVILAFVAMVGLGYIFSEGTADNWYDGCTPRRFCRLFCLYRFRCHVYYCRGVQKPAARSSPRHDLFAADLYLNLCRDYPGHYGNGQLSGI